MSLVPELRTLVTVALATLLDVYFESYVLKEAEVPVSNLHRCISDPKCLAQVRSSGKSNLKMIG